LFFYNLKIITALRNQNINIICSYNIDLTKKAGNRWFKMLEDKSPMFSILTDKMWKLNVNLVFIRYFLFTVIYFLTYESEFSVELRIILKNR